MSKIIFDSPVIAENAQFGDNNTQYNNHGQINNINWELIEKEYSKIRYVKKNDELHKAIKTRKIDKVKNAVKRNIENYGINVLSDLSSAGILEIFKLFL